MKGSRYAEKLAALQALTVCLQAYGKLHILGSMIAAAAHEESGSDVVLLLELAFWTFVVLLGLNVVYPAMLLRHPSALRVRPFSTAPTRSAIWGPVWWP